MTTLDPASGHVVLINTFTVEPERAEELLAALSEATRETLSGLTGFVSANLHLGRDGRHVTNYAQWESQADLDAMMANPGAMAHMQQTAAMAIAFEPLYYDLREVHDSPDS